MADLVNKQDCQQRNCYKKIPTRQDAVRKAIDTPEHARKRVAKINKSIQDRIVECPAIYKVFAADLSIYKRFRPYKR